MFMKMGGGSREPPPACLRYECCRASSEDISLQCDARLLAREAEQRYQLHVREQRVRELEQEQYYSRIV